MFHDRFIEKKSVDTLQGKYDVLRGKFFLSYTRIFGFRNFFVVHQECSLAHFRSEMSV